VLTVLVHIMSEEVQEEMFPVEAVHNAWLEGYSEFDLDKEMPEPPYNAGTLEYESWLDGWEDKKEEMEALERRLSS